MSNYATTKVNYEYINQLPNSDAEWFSAIISPDAKTVSLFIHIDEPEDMMYMVDQAKYSGKVDSIIDGFVEKINSGTYEKYYGLSIDTICNANPELTLNAIPITMAQRACPIRIDDDGCFDE